MDALRIGDRLVAAELITEEQLIEALKRQKEMRADGRSAESTLVGMVLIELGFITKDDLYQYLFSETS